MPVSLKDWLAASGKPVEVAISRFIQEGRLDPNLLMSAIGNGEEFARILESGFRSQSALAALINDEVLKPLGSVAVDGGTFKLASFYRRATFEDGFEISRQDSFERLLDEVGDEEVAVPERFLAVHWLLQDVKPDELIQRIGCEADVRTVLGYLANLISKYINDESSVPFDSEANIFLAGSVAIRCRRCPAFREWIFVVSPLWDAKELFEKDCKVFSRGCLAR